MVSDGRMHPAIAIEDEDPNHVLFLAILVFLFQDFFSEEIGRRVIRRKHLQIVVSDLEKQEVIQWII